MSTDYAENLIPLPSHLRALDGQIIDLDTDVWRIRVSIEGGQFLSIKWDNLREIRTKVSLSDYAIALIQHYIAYRIERKKPYSVYNDFNSLLQFAHWLDQQGEIEFPMLRMRCFGWMDLTEEIGRSFLAWSIANTFERGNHLSRLKTFYEWGVAFEHSGFDVQQLQRLKSIRAGSNLKGISVRSRHPKRGPFSPDERWLLVNAIKQGKGTDRDRALVMLHLELGLNPSATVRMRNSDYKVLQSSEGEFYQIDVPRIKKRPVDRAVKRRPMSRILGKLIHQLQQGDPNDTLFFWLAPNSPENSIRQALKRFAEDAQIISPRTNKLITLTPRRLRYTIATDMAEHGASAFHIAEVLDHTDLQHVGVYTATVSSIADHVASATDTVLGPLVRRFQGTLIGSPDEQLVEEQLNQVIPAAVPHLSIPLINTGGLGVCGRNIRRDGLCQLLPPLSCYLCPNFAALRSGPHRELLENIETFLTIHAVDTDQRIREQLDDIRKALYEVLNQLEGSTPSTI